jgi:hypothetical protein
MFAASSEFSTTSLESADFPCLANEVVLLAAKHCRLLPQVRGAVSEPIDAERTTWDLRQLSEWANEFLGCDWELVTGAESGVIVLEIDARCDFAAIQILNEIDSMETLRARAGSKSLMFLRYPEEMLARQRGKVVLAPGLAVRVDGDQVVIPPHAAGSWPDLDAPIVDAPEWLRICAFEPDEEKALPLESSAAHAGGDARLGTYEQEEPQESNAREKQEGGNTHCRLP